MAMPQADAAEKIGGREAKVVRCKTKNDDAAFTVWIEIDDRAFALPK